jgi:hypothetical protein
VKWRGTVNVVFWFCGLLAITAAGPMVVVWPRVVWFVVVVVVAAAAVSVMVTVGWWWDHRAEHRSSTRGFDGGDRA